MPIDFCGCTKTEVRHDRDKGKTKLVGLEGGAKQQDEWYGKGRRLFNPCKPNTANKPQAMRCTICQREKSLVSTISEEAPKENKKK